MEDYFSALKDMIYSGRSVTIGMTMEGKPFIGYTLTGRSPPSQARKLVLEPEKDVVRSEVTNPEQLKKGNPALLLYPAITYSGGRIVASNGAQTRLISELSEKIHIHLRTFTPAIILQEAMSLDVWEKGINITSYEPDEPNYTPRISGATDGFKGGFHIVKKVGEGKKSYLESFDLIKGQGKIIATYKGGNESPLLPFEGLAREAKISSIHGQDILESLYDAINKINPEDNKNYAVSAAVAIRDERGIEFFIKNRFE